MLTEAEGLRYLANKAKIKALEEENEELLRSANVRDADPGTYTEGKVVVEVSRNARFDSTLAAKLYPLGEDGTNLELYDAVISSTKAKRHLTPEQYEQVQKVYPNNRVEVKVSE